MLDINTFKARNEEAQAINIKIQQARGAIEENKRQFAELCAKYKATYNQDITAENLAQILAECEAEIEKQSEEQALAIERAKAGIIVKNDEAEGTVNTPNTAVNTAQGTTNTPNMVGNTAQGTINQAQTAVMPTPQPVQATNPVGIIPNAPTQMSNPISVSAFGAGAIQASAPTDVKMPTIQPTQPAPIQPTQQVAGWGQQGTPDFNSILGGKFGG